MPHVIFRMFDYTDCPEVLIKVFSNQTCGLLEVKVQANILFLFFFFPQGPILPGAHSIERFLIEEHLHQIVEMHHLERKDWYVFNKHYFFVTLLWVTSNFLISEYVMLLVHFI
jgi:nuclear cap-binding protein subunit 1